MILLSFWGAFHLHLFLSSCDMPGAAGTESGWEALAHHFGPLGSIVAKTKSLNIN